MFSDIPGAVDDFGTFGLQRYFFLIDSAATSKLKNLRNCSISKPAAGEREATL